MNKITLNDVKNHIRKCKQLGVGYNWLGFVENKDLTPEVEALFSSGSRNQMWDWVNGNSKLRGLEVFVK